MITARAFLLLFLYLEYGAACCTRWHYNSAYANCGTDVDVPNDEGKLPIHLAAEAGHLEDVEALLQCGVDPNLPDQNDMRPIYYAVQEDNERIVEVLLNAGADPNCKGSDGKNLLFRAVKNNHEKVVRILLKNLAKYVSLQNEDRLLQNETVSTNQLSLSPAYKEDLVGTSATKGCPPHATLPVTTDDLSTFIGARVYQEGHEVPPLACSGEMTDYLSGTYSSDLPNSQRSWYFGALYVHHGCEFYAFKGFDYEGKLHLFRGPYYSNCVFPSNVVPECQQIGYSFIVSCQQQMPSCVPTDEWATVGYFDNSASELTTTYTYTYSIGTSWSSEMSKGFSVDGSIEYAMSAGFFKLFETSLAVSVETGYNWSKTSSRAKAITTEHSMATAVKGGYIIEIQQTKGTCGGSDVETELFRSVSYNLNNDERNITDFTH